MTWEVKQQNKQKLIFFRMTDRKHERFVKAFDAPSVKLLHVGGIVFVMINSMAMEGDGCHICSEAMSKLRDIKWKLKCAKVSLWKCL